MKANNLSIISALLFLLVIFSNFSMYFIKIENAKHINDDSVKITFDKNSFNKIGILDPLTDYTSYGIDLLHIKTNTKIELISSENINYIITADHNTHYYINDKGFINDNIHNDKKEKEINFHYFYNKEHLEIKKYTWKFQISYMSKPYQENPSTREEKLTNEYKSNIRYLTDYANKHDLDSAFIKLWRNYFFWDTEEKRLFVANNHSKWKKEYLIYLKSRKDIFKSDELLYLSSYRRAAQYMGYLIASLSYPSPALSLTKRYDITMKNFSGKTRDYLLTRLLLLAIDKKNISTSNEELKKCITNYIKDCKTESYSNYIKLHLNYLNIKNSENDILYTHDGKNIPLKNILDTLNLAYIDFWASWCLPCRAEIPSSKRLKDEFETKGVNFVYISIDESIVAWERAVSQLKIDKKKSYLIIKGKNSSFAKQHKIFSIPHYILLGKNGSIISNNAPRPSDPLTKELLTKVID